MIWVPDDAGVVQVEKPGPSEENVRKTRSRPGALSRSSDKQSLEHCSTARVATISWLVPTTGLMKSLKLHMWSGGDWPPGYFPQEAKSVVENRLKSGHA